MQTCFVGKSFSELSWESCLVRGTLDTSWYRGIVATTIEVVSLTAAIGTAACGCLRLL